MMECKIRSVSTNMHMIFQFFTLISYTYLQICNPIYYLQILRRGIHHVLGFQIPIFVQTAGYMICDYVL